MRINLDYLIDCKNCGCLFNYITAEFETSKHKRYKGKCPCCKHDYYIIDKELDNSLKEDSP